MNITTGYYINFYESGGVDLYVIINEANDVSLEKICKAEEYMEDKDLSSITNKELEDAMDRIFEYGVQIVRRE